MDLTILTWLRVWSIWPHFYEDQNRYAEAEPPTKRALGPDHSYVAVALSNLAVQYERQNRHSEAEPLLKRALAIQERALGPDHPLVANVLNSLGEVHIAQDHYAEAEPLLKRALTIECSGWSIFPGRRGCKRLPICRSLGRRVSR